MRCVIVLATLAGCADVGTAPTFGGPITFENGTNTISTGTYELRLLANDSYTTIASCTFAVQ